MDKEVRKYECGYCGYYFFAKIGISSGKKTVKDAAKCPQCNNFSRVDDNI